LKKNIPQCHSVTFMHAYQLYGISEVEHEQQTVGAPTEPSRRELNFGQLKLTQ